MKKLYASLIVFALLSQGWACHYADSATNTAGSEPGAQAQEATENVPASTFNINRPDKKWELDKDLEEISGLGWLDGQHLLAISDNKPGLYIIDIARNGAIEDHIQYDGDKKKHQYDWEGVTVIGNAAYAVGSDGDIYRFENYKETSSAKKIGTSLDDDNDVEGICFDPVTRDILLACKGDPGVKGKDLKAVYRFDIDKEKVDKQPYFTVDDDDLEKLAGKKVALHPSAIAVHPANHDIYILSTRGTKCLLRCTREGKPVSILFIDPSALAQPEGLCFSPGGEMYISSEAVSGKAIIFYYAAAGE